MKKTKEPQQEKQLENPHTVTLTQAHQRTGLSKKVLTRLANEGHIRKTKPGKEVLIFWDSLKQYLTKTTVRSA